MHGTHKYGLVTMSITTIINKVRRTDYEYNSSMDDNQWIGVLLLLERLLSVNNLVTFLGHNCIILFNKYYPMLMLQNT